MSSSSSTFEILPFLEKSQEKLDFFEWDNHFDGFNFNHSCNCNFVHFYNRLMNRFHLCIEIQAHRHRENEFNSSFSFAKLYNCMWSGKWASQSTMKRHIRQWSKLTQLLNTNLNSVLHHRNPFECHLKK